MLLLAVASALPSSPPTGQAAPLGAADGQTTTITDLDGIARSLTIEQKVGQLLLLGFDGSSADAAQPEIVDLQAGGIVLLNNGSVAADVQSLVQGLQATAQTADSLPLLVAIDQEGGDVQRIREGVTQFGSNWELGRVQPLTQAIAAACARGATHGRELSALGINLNFAPVLDVWDNPRNTVIGTRSYSDDPDRAAVLGAAYIEGLQGNGVLATGKHFPGHGSTDEDSHFGLPILYHDRARLDDVELVPFRRAMAARVAAIMTAHVSYPLVDPIPDRPASLSPVIVGQLLRGDLNYDGLVVTDEIGGMRAITDAYSAGDAAVQAILAGNDMVTIEGPPSSQYQARDALLAAIGQQISVDRLDQSVRRILRAKQEAGLILGQNPADLVPQAPLCTSP